MIHALCARKNLVWAAGVAYVDNQIGDPSSVCIAQMLALA
jgi:hypothetical protein